jgi:hypothetical protein
MAVERAQEIIDKAAHEREKLVAFVRSVPAAGWSKTSPGGIWQARDYIAHLASIDPLITNWFRVVQGGEGGGGYRGRAFSIDEWNEEQILARRERSMDELLEEAAHNRSDLNAALAAFTEPQLDGEIHFGGDAKRAPRDVPLYLYLRGWVFHDRWHMEDARRAMAGKEEQPFGDEAFARAMQGGDRPS